MAEQGLEPGSCRSTSPSQTALASWQPLPAGMCLFKRIVLPQLHLLIPAGVINKEQFH